MEVWTFGHFPNTVNNDLKHGVSGLKDSVFIS